MQYNLRHDTDSKTALFAPPSNQDMQLDGYGGIGIPNY